MKELKNKISFKNYFSIGDKRVESHLVKKGGKKIKIKNLINFFKKEEGIENPFLADGEVNEFIEKYKDHFSKKRPLYFLVKNEVHTFIKKLENGEVKSVFNEIKFKKGYIIVASKVMKKEVIRSY